MDFIFALCVCSFLLSFLFIIKIESIFVLTLWYRMILSVLPLEMMGRQSSHHCGLIIVMMLEWLLTLIQWDSLFCIRIFILFTNKQFGSYCYYVLSISVLNSTVCFRPSVEQTHLLWIFHWILSPLLLFLSNSSFLGWQIVTMLIDLVWICGTYLICNNVASRMFIVTQFT